MENRIQINGEWYVKESAEVTSYKWKITDEQLTHSVHCIWQATFWSFDAYLLLHGDENNIKDRHNGVFINIIDQRPDKKEDWIEHYIDSDIWLIDIFDGASDEMFDEDGLAYFRTFLNKLIEKGWLKRTQ